MKIENLLPIPNQNYSTTDNVFIIDILDGVPQTHVSFNQKVSTKKEGTLSESIYLNLSILDN